MKKELKGIKIFLIIYGGAMAGISIIWTIMLGVFWLIFSYDVFAKTTMIFMPILIFIGLAFLFSGIYITKIKVKRTLLHLIISISSILWYILFVIFLPHHNTLLDINNPDLIGVLFTVIPYIYATASSAIFIVPELIIWRKLRKFERQNNTEENNNAT